MRGWPRAASLRVGNRRLRTGFRQLAVHNLLVAVSDSSENKIWREKGKRLLKCAFESRKCTVDTNTFPSDGSFMKRSQVSLISDIFGLGDPGKILKEIWERLDTIVIQRNYIAHGKMTPEEVGRSYSSSEVKNLVDLWKKG